jgi:hypothetical protein
MPTIETRVIRAVQSGDRRFVCGMPMSSSGHAIAIEMEQAWHAFRSFNYSAWVRSSACGYRMLIPLWSLGVRTLLDHLFASADERMAATQEAARAMHIHGELAEAHLEEKLGQPGRQHSCRRLRMAIRLVRKSTTQRSE